MDSEEKKIRETFKSSFHEEWVDLGDSYIDIHLEEDSEEDTEEDTSNFKKPSSTENQELSSSENCQDVLEYLYGKLKDLFSMNDIVKSLQYILSKAEKKMQRFPIQSIFVKLILKTMVECLRRLLLPVSC